MGLELKDFIVTPLLLLLMFFLVRRKQAKHLPYDPRYRYYSRAFLARVIAGFSFTMVYLFYYGGGDAISYYNQVDALYNFFFDHPAKALGFIFSGQDRFPYQLRPYIYDNIYIWRGVASVTTIKILSIVNFFSFSSFLGTSLLLNFLAFISSWRLFLVLSKIYPRLVKQIALGVLFIPSVLFWSSGILKDTVTWCFLCFLISAFIETAILKEKIFKNLLIIALSAFIISLIKGYLILAALPMMLFTFFGSFLAGTKNTALRYLMTPMVIAIATFSAFFLVNTIGDEISTYSLGSLENKAKGFEMWHSYLYENYGGSGYSLGPIEFTPVGLLRKFPAAINVSLFRPYLWEADSPIIFLSAIESVFFFLFSIYVLIRARVFSFFKTILDDPMLLFMMGFSLLLAASVGLTSYNFGALVRYKIPCLPFFVISLFILLDYSKRARKSGAVASTEYLAPAVSKA